MGDIEQLRQVFGKTWDWSTAGEEWSGWWGGTPALWYGALLPRIHSFVPTGTILEIAPGFGRWTQYLVDLADRLILVDLAPNCIDHCRERFAGRRNVEYYVNDGRSLSMVDDCSIDFVFSWDSLVHADADIISDYILQLSRKLSADGVAFIHHSNVRSQLISHQLAMRTPQRVRRPLVKRGLMLDVYAWRSPTVNAAAVAQMCDRAGLLCVSQELFNWEHGPYLTDAISILVRPASSWARAPRMVRNRFFHKEARRMAAHYARTGFPAASREL